MGLRHFCTPVANHETKNWVKLNQVKMAFIFQVSGTKKCYQIRIVFVSEGLIEGVKIPLLFAKPKGFHSKGDPCRKGDDAYNLEHILTSFIILALTFVKKYLLLVKKNIYINPRNVLP